MLRFLFRLGRPRPASDPGLQREVEDALARARQQFVQVRQELVVARGDPARAGLLEAMAARLREEIRLTEAALGELAPAPPPAGIPAGPAFRETLGMPGRHRIVSEGEPVARLQQALQDLGVPCEVTGRFDAATKAALLSWQASEGLPQSGMLDARSRSRLNARLGATGDPG